MNFAKILRHLIQNFLNILIKVKIQITTTLEGLCQLQFKESFWWSLDWLLALLNFNLFYILSRKEIRSVIAWYLQKCHSSSTLCFDNFCLWIQSCQMCYSKTHLLTSNSKFTFDRKNYHVMKSIEKHWVLQTPVLLNNSWDLHWMINRAYF